MPLDEIPVRVHFVGAVHREIHGGNFLEAHQRNPSERAKTSVAREVGIPRTSKPTRTRAPSSRTKPAAARPVPSPITIPGLAHEAARTAISQVFKASRERYQR